MAKRKRLTPAQAGFLSGAAPETKSAQPPIAQVAGEAAAVSALSTLSAEWDTARAEGRLIVALDLDAVVDDHLVRDRATMDEEAMQSLRQSLLARGQQTPIEVTDLGQGRYGLISGWRRLTALRALLQETEERRFSTVQALIRQPADQAQSYVAMVEENEIRADLSFYERARIVLKSLEAGVFETEKEALQTLFSTGSYARRSKIKSFIPVVTALEGALRFPHRLSERAGLALSKGLSADPKLAARLRKTLTARAPDTAEAESALLLEALRPAPKKEPEQTSQTDQSPGPEIAISFKPGEILLEGEGVTEALHKRLTAWLSGKD